VTELETMLDPTGRPGHEDHAGLAPRLDTLQGARIALLNSTKPNSVVLLEQLGQILKEEHGAASTTLYSKASFAVPLDDALLASIAEQCDVAIAGVGD